MIRKIAPLLIAAICFSSCTKDDDSEPTTDEFIAPIVVGDLKSVYGFLAPSIGNNGNRLSIKYKDGAVSAVDLIHQHSGADTLFESQVRYTWFRLNNGETLLKGKYLNRPSDSVDYYMSGNNLINGFHKGADLSGFMKNSDRSYRYKDGKLESIDGFENKSQVFNIDIVCDSRGNIIEVSNGNNASKIKYDNRPNPYRGIVGLWDLPQTTGTIEYFSHDLKYFNTNNVIEITTFFMGFETANFKHVLTYDDKGRLVKDSSSYSLHTFEYN